MSRFASPELLPLLILVPLAAAVAGLLWRRRLVATRAWAARGLWDRLLPGFRRGRIVALVVLLAASVAGVALGLARPRWGTVEEEVERRGVNVVFVVDSSLSMAATDVPPSRLEAAKVVVGRMLDRLGGHRFGLVQAEGEGEVLAPLTLDRGMIDLLLSSVEPASLLTPGTHLDAGLRKAAALFPEEEGTAEVVILLSDGEDHGGAWDETVRRVASTDMVVHVVGLGTEAGAALPLPAGGRAGVKTDAEGRPVVSHLEAGTLAALAEATGGELVLAADPAVDVSPIVEAVDALHESSLGTETVRQERERFQWFLAPAAALLALLLATSPMAAGRQEEGR